MGNRESLRIGEAAGLLEISTNTIRYYHEVGLLPEPGRTGGGYRLYDADDVLALRRILRLRSLGLPIREVKRILAEPDERALRGSLTELEQELSARILELEGRRERVRELLERDDPGEVLDGPDGSLGESLEDEEWRDIVEELEAEHPPSPEEIEEGRRLERMLGAFRWPASIRLMFEDVFRQVKLVRERDPEGWRRSIEPTAELSRRFGALRKVPEDSPEVERLVADFLEYDREYPLEPELEDLPRRHEATIESPVFRLATALVLRTFSPAQRRFMAELEKARAKEERGDGS